MTPFEALDELRTYCRLSVEKTSDFGNIVLEAMQEYLSLIEDARNRIVNDTMIFENLLKGNQPKQGFQKWINKNNEVIEKLNDAMKDWPDEDE